jgi:hypothetical protein
MNATLSMAPRPMCEKVRKIDPISRGGPGHAHCSFAARTEVAFVSCQQVRFALADCVVEISPEVGEGSRKARAYTARLSLVENEGTIVRPLVTGNGRRVKIRAESELLALHSAVSYLRARFGSVSRDGLPCALGGATVGMPVAVDDADADASTF